jgi:hypothetical protein
MTGRYGMKPQNRRRSQTGPLCALAGVLILVFVLQSFIGGVLSAGDRNFGEGLSTATQSAYCDAIGRRDPNLPAQGGAHSTCCILCSGDDAQLLPSKSAWTAIRRPAQNARPLLWFVATQPLVSPPPAGWGSSWVSQAPPLFS